MTNEDVMVEMLVCIRRDGVVMSRVSKLDQEVNPNVADLMLIGALGIVEQSLRMARNGRIKGDAK